MVGTIDISRSTPWRSALIHIAAAGTWIVLLLAAVDGSSRAAKAIAVLYLGYDILLMAFIAWQARRLSAVPRDGVVSRATIGVVVAAFNECRVLPGTIDALLAQSQPPDQIVVADDGSDDETPTVLAQRYGLSPPVLGELSAPAPLHPSLRWLRLPHRGKATALNAAIEVMESGIIITMDADTVAAPGAICAMGSAFDADPALVAATGVLTPLCRRSPGGRLFEWFQAAEYRRNFLGRQAWARLGTLLLISGAFAGYRREALRRVGGFEPRCLVEDYEVIHRLYRHAGSHGLRWRTGVIGGATAVTAAPDTVRGFLRQRSRWFGGFLQTQYRHRDMVGDGRYGLVGLVMLPIKSLDALQPLYGLATLALFIGSLVASGHLAPARFLAPAVCAKLLLDLAFQLWSNQVYRRWIGGDAVSPWRAALLTLAEPFGFLILRHAGAAWGWFIFLTGRHAWSQQSRDGLLASPPPGIVIGHAAISARDRKPPPPRPIAILPGTSLATPARRTSR